MVSGILAASRLFLSNGLAGNRTWMHRIACKFGRRNALLFGQIPQRKNKMARAGSPGQHKLLLCGRFLLDDDLQVRGHIFVQLHGDGELSHGLQRLVQLDFAAVEVESLFGQCVDDVARRY